MDVEGYFDDFANRDWYEPVEGGQVRIAVVGLGGFARSSALPAIRDAELCESTVLVSSSPEKAQDVASRFGAERTLTYGEFHDGAATDHYDAVYIAAPNAFHLEYAVSAAEFGKHVICEKPLETTSERARRMIEACESAGVTLMTAYRLQLEPAVRRTREMMRDECIGEPVQVHSGFSSHVLEIGGPNQWRLDPELAGGGAMMDLGIYPLNTIRFLLSEDPHSVQATTTSTHGAFENVEEHVAFQLTFPGGITASCTASFNAQPDSRLFVLGRTGRIMIWSAYGGDIPHDIALQCGDMEAEYTGSPINEITEEFDYFAYCVLTGTTPEPDGKDGLRDLEVVEAIYESADTGERVFL